MNSADSVCSAFSLPVHVSSLSRQGRFSQSCTICGSGALVDDKFCRHCGAQRRAEGKAFEAIHLLAPTIGLDEPSLYATAPLQPEDSYHAISGPLVKSATGRLAANNTSRLKGRWSRGLILALISIPIWLMIVLLSPFDAYAAARATVKQH